MKNPIQKLMDKLIESQKISIQNMIDITPFLLDANKDFEQHIIEAHNKGQQYYHPGYNPDVSEQYYKETYETKTSH